MLIKTTVDVSDGLALCDLILKKLSYATNNALARTARELVEFERGALGSDFQIRKSGRHGSFVADRVQVLKWPKAGDLWAYVGINANVKGAPLLLPYFEEGGEKEPSLGSEIAVPLTDSPARPEFPSKVPRNLLYKMLHLERHITANGRVQYKGDNRTFVIPGLGVFIRGGAIKDREKRKKVFIGKAGRELQETTQTRMIYKYVSSAPLHQQMQFVRSAREFVAKRFPDIWCEEFVKELKGRARL